MYLSFIKIYNSKKRAPEKQMIVFRGSLEISFIYSDIFWNYSVAVTAPFDM